MKEEEEIWKDIKGFEGYYQVSNLGRIKSVTRSIMRSNNHKQSFKEKIIVPRKHIYLSISLHKKGQIMSKDVHRLVAETFIPNPNNLPCINHKDENKFNNNVENLEWCTYQYNNSYGTKPQKIAKIQLGNKNMLGKQHTEESKHRISESKLSQNFHHTKSARQLMSKKRQNRIWINNNINEKWIDRTELDNYLQSGYILGRKFKKQGRA